MAFDPLLPVNNSEIEAPELRGQFTGLFDLIQTIPVGPTGPAGVNAAVVDGVTTANPGESASATANLAADTVHFSFTIPRGEVGATGTTGAIGAVGGPGPTGPPFTSFVIESVTSIDSALPATVTAVFDGTNVKLSFALPRGERGNQGEQGMIGSTGATGPAFTNFLVAGVTTLDASFPATVNTAFDGSAVTFNFGIPRGFQGDIGSPGGPGPQGAPGEVSLAELNAAIANTSSNSNAVVALATPYADPDAEELRQKLNELIVALRR